MSTYKDVFGARTLLEGVDDTISYYRLDSLIKQGVQGLDRLPFTVKILLENLLRHVDGELVTEADVLALANKIIR